MKTGKWNKSLSLRYMFVIFGQDLWRSQFLQTFFWGSFVKNVAILVLAGCLVSINPQVTKAGLFDTRIPISAEDFIEKKVKKTANDEIKTYVSALAGIMVLHLLIRR